MQDWLYRFYPEHPDLAAAAETAVMALGGSKRPFPGGCAGRAMAKVLPWRMVRKLQTIAYRSGWQGVLRARIKTP
jgi:hypothetical protein